MNKNIFIAILASTLFFSCKRKNDILVNLDTVQKRDITETVTASGKIQPVVEIKIGSDISGEVIAIHVNEGDSVAEGTLLLEINPDILQSNYERAEASLNNALAGSAGAKARVEQAKAQFIRAELDFKRNKGLYDQNAISKSEYDAFVANYEVAKAELTAAEQNEIAAKYTVESTRAAVKEAKNNLTRTKIYAPTSGIVTKLNIEKGERVIGAAQMNITELMRIANTSEMLVKVNVNENDIVRVSVGDTADIEVGAYRKRKFQGVVTRVANSVVGNALGQSGSDEVANYEVVINILKSSYQDLITPQNKNLSPFNSGMSASVEIKTQVSKGVLSVPIQSVTARPDTTSANNEYREFVFVYENEKVILSPVITGIQDNKYIEIKSGIQENQTIVEGPYTIVAKTLNNGDKVIVEKK
jgi:HlyD family secretion protein